MNKNNTNFIVFITIAIFYLFGNMIWYIINTPIIIQGVYCDYFCRALMEWKFFYYDIAPLIIWIMKGCLKIFGNKYFDLEIIFMNWFFFLMALYFINKICIEIKDKETGIIAMILFALTPCVYGASRQYGHHDYHIMCILLFNIYCLIKTEDFTSRKWSVIYGISVGVGLLAKDTFLAYFFVPWLYIAIRSLKEKLKYNKKQKIINILITILIGSLIAGYHYFRAETIFKIFKDPLVEAYYPYFAFENIRVFTTGLSEYLLSFPIFLLFVIGFFWYLFKYKDIKYKYIFLLWIIVPWILLMIMRHFKVPDYSLGFVPSMIIIISLYVSSINKSIYKKILSIIFVIICLLQYISFSYGINIGLFSLKINLKGYDFYYFDKEADFGYYPNMFVYNHEKRDYCMSILKYLENNFKNKVFFMYKYTGTSYFCTEELYTVLKLYDFDLKINFEEILDSDIILFNKTYPIVDITFVTNFEKGKREEHLESYNIKELSRDIVLIINKIKDDYIKLDEFDLNVNDIITDEQHMIVLGKKKLFGNNSNKLRYKYKLLDL